MFARTTKVIAATALALTIATSAVADQRRYHQHQQYRQQQQYQHRHHNGNAGAWIAGAVGLGILGAIIAAESQQQCWDEMAGYDRYGREIWRTYCR